MEKTEVEPTSATEITANILYLIQVSCGVPGVSILKKILLYHNVVYFSTISIGLSSVVLVLTLLESYAGTATW